jgi:hypothetical protein
MGRAAAAGDEGLGVIQRRHFAALIALVVLVLVAIGVFAWRAWDSTDEGPLAEPIAVTASMTPEQHMFGDPLRARVDLIVDTGRVDPDTVRVRVNFAPYRPLRQPQRTESSAGEIARLRFDYALACLGYRCVPLEGRRDFDLRNATVEYRTRGGEGVQTEEIDWPTLEATGRIESTQLFAAQLRSNYRDLGPITYRFSPRTVQLVALLLAVLFAAAALILVLRLLPLARIAERLGLKTIDTRSPLERALARVHETAEQPDEGRRALERLAHELRRVRNPDLARAASRLAWSRDFPADGRLTTLSADVQRLISEAK